MEKQLITILIDRFIDFITRTIVPMSAMLLIFILFDSLFTHSKFQELLLKYFLTDDHNLKLGIFFIASIGFGLLISIIHQSLDAFNRKNFDCIWKNKDFQSLREKVVKKLENNKILDKLPHDAYSKDHLTDFKLYNILGNEKVFGNLINVRRYIDQAKQLYTILIGLALNILLFFTFSACKEKNSIVIIVSALAVFSLIVIAICAARNRYLARNTRLYINYLIQDISDEKKSDT